MVLHPLIYFQIFPNFFLLKCPVILKEDDIMTLGEVTEDRRLVIMTEDLHIHQGITKDLIHRSLTKSQRMEWRSILGMTIWNWKMEK